MKAKKINEYAGSGYSASYSVAGKTSGLSGFRGFNGLNTPYQYTIIPLNHFFEPKPSYPVHDPYLIIKGTKIKGLSINSNKEYTGNVISIKYDENKNVLFYTIIIDKLNKLINIEPTSAEPFINYENEHDPLKALFVSSFMNNIK